MNRRFFSLFVPLVVACSSSSPASTTTSPSSPPDAGSSDGTTPEAVLGALTIAASATRIQPPRDHHTTLVVAVDAKPYLYVFGGTDSWDTILDDVQRAAIGDDGGLGELETIGHLPEPRAGHTTIFVEGKFVLAGGLSGLSGASGFELDTTTVAELRGDGTLGPWTMGPRLPSPVMHHTCHAHARAMYCVGGRIKGNLTTDLAVRTELGPDGKLLPFAPITALPLSIGFQQAFVHGARLYVAGGLHRSTPTDAFDRRKEILSLSLEDGGKGAWTPAGELPAARNVGAAEVLGDRVFVSGGVDGDDQSMGSVAEGTFAPDGTVSFTMTKAKLSVPRAHIHQTPVYGHSMFIVGGRADNGKSVGLVDVGVFE